MLGSAMRETAPVELRVEDVHVSFGALRVLRGVDLEIRSGETVAIVGASGCGKTVLLQVILRNLRPERGRVLIAEHEKGGALADLHRLSERRMEGVRRHWAVVFQRNALFSGSVLDNVGLWLREIAGIRDETEIRRRAEEALRDVGFEPDDTLLRKQRDELSGGMQKRVAVARALAMDPLLVFYDEPTTGLDPSLAEQVHELIREVHESRHGTGARRTTVIITHDKDLLFRLQPRVVMIHEGRAFFDGPYEEFADSDSEVVRPYFDLMPELHARELPAD
jgi:phospholipid/cholesterol/gamma-HCH transport system ATP-binding protein